MLTSNSVYQFDCDCNSSYIGHRKKLLDQRILQHRTHTTSHIYKHISICNIYKEKLIENFGSDPTDNAQREFIKNHFKILERNLHNYHARITYEGLMITLKNPDLNKQVSHKSMTFLCDCPNYKIENSVGT